jgi:glycosyltransferase involved in cell wall biosynthesis
MGLGYNLSCFIITKNEEKRIARAINSVKNIVSEVIVVDSGSVDNTVSIAESLGATVLFKEWPGYVKQKSFAEKLCKYDWVLNIDADEELSCELQEEIRYLFLSKNCTRYNAYAVNFVILYRNENLPRKFAPANKFIRLYNRNFCSFSNTINHTTHDAVTFNQDNDQKGNIVYNLSGMAFHRSGVSLEQLVAKANFYSGEQAKDLIKNGRVPNAFRTFFEMPLWVLKTFFIRRYWVFGFDGLVDSVVFAFARFLRLAKAREIFSSRDKT